jgi:NAD-dependent dihydropyrimidine dehydrogenase PreA subunit
MQQHKLPREKIPWFPTIDYDACTGDRECLEFCKNNVFSWDEVLGHPLVENPYNCVLGCNACAQICPVEAIHFPTKEELRQTIRELLAAQPYEAAPAGGQP